jgi:hypothetical protein
MIKTKCIGFTGTRNGLTNKQRKSLYDTLYDLRRDFDTVHHGDCIGADREACEDALELCYTLNCHPPDKPSKRAFIDSHKYNDPVPYLDRNRSIVDSCKLLIACPFENKEIVRSGTWSTIRYARSVNKETIIIYPSGEISEF